MPDLENSQWLGYELHDGLLQWVVGARMQLEVALAATADPPQRKRLKQTLRFIELAIEEGRGLIGFIEEQSTNRPHDFAAMIDQFVHALQPLAKDRQQEIVFHRAERPWPELPQSVLWNMLRVAQQGVRNAISHAGPATITITCSWIDDRHIQLQVDDTGVGFDQTRAAPTTTTTSHFGVSSMHHRASLIHGNLEITSAPEQGCHVKLTLAVPNED